MKQDDPKKEIQNDLNNGEFTKICSNETTFKEYVFDKIDRIREDEREKLTHLLIQSMPRDAENLSSLTGWQARETIQNFLDELIK